jgi:hypothetical protein
VISEREDAVGLKVYRRVILLVCLRVKRKACLRIDEKLSTCNSINNHTPPR